MNPALQGYLVAMEESLAADAGLADAGAELHAVADLVEGTNALLLALNDGSVPVTARRAVLDHLLTGKARPEVVRLVHQAVTVVPAGEVVSAFRWMGSRLEHVASRPPATAAEPFDEEILGRLGSRNRVSGYAAAVFESLTVADLEEIEDQLFRFARTVEADRPLRRALGDRDLPVVVRQDVIARLLDGKVLDATVRLARYAARGGRARDIVATLDTLVDDAAKARGWRVAKVQAASAVDDAHQHDLGEALALLTGNPVDLQVTVEPSLLGGVVVQVGDLLVDSSTRHRLDELKEHLLASEEAYRIPGTPTRREATDG
ncbi:MAG TPA: F0F1 ATP synthase subunit delta [Acidimicrobiales bacterium]|nr:F0F1 ATP synthase subunit delta [Acidimicrobiales bacterium]